MVNSVFHLIPYYLLIGVPIYLLIYKEVNYAVNLMIVWGELTDENWNKKGNSISILMMHILLFIFWPTTLWAIHGLLSLVADRKSIQKVLFSWWKEEDNA